MRQSVVPRFVHGDPRGGAPLLTIVVIALLVIVGLTLGAGVVGDLFGSIGQTIENTQAGIP